MVITWNYSGGLLSHYKNMPAALRRRCYDVRGGIAIAVGGTIEYLYGTATVALELRHNVERVTVVRSDLFSDLKPGQANIYY